MTQEEIKRYPDSLKIDNGISGLQSAGILPKKVGDVKPAFSDDNATLSLHIFTRLNVTEISMYAALSDLSLVHPLSLKRNVCVILKTVEEADAKIEEVLKKLGVKGNYTVTSSDDINQKVIQQSDMFIISADIFEAASKSVRSQIRNSPGKEIFCLQTNEGRKSYESKLKKILHKTVLLAKASDASLSVKVAHSGMTAKDIKDNVLIVLKKLNITERFRGGWSAIKQVGLKTGSSQLVSIFESTDERIVRVSKALKRKSTDGTDESAEPEQKKAKVAKPNRKRKNANRHANEHPNNAKENKKDEALGNTNNAGKPKANEVNSPKGKRNKQKKGKATESPTSNDLVNMLINRAKETVFTEQVPAVKSPKQKKKKNKTPKKVNLVTPLANGNPIAKVNGSPAKTTPKKNKKNKSPKVNLVKPLANGNPMAKENGTPAKKTSKQKKRKIKSPKPIVFVKAEDPAQ